MPGYGRRGRMVERGEWVPGDAPPDEAYWEALLRNGEHGPAAPPLTDQSSEQDNETSFPASTTDAATATSRDDPWKAAREAMDEGKIIELPVVSCNRGGVLVGWNGLRGFVPASHLSSLPPVSDEDERYEQLRQLIGRQLQLKVIEIDPEHGRVVLSERASCLDDDHRQEVLDALCPGDICEGNVTNLCSFGAFVDLGGLEGLIHVSELSWGRVDHPSDVLEHNQSVEVYVLNIDRERGRVGLSLKRLLPDPWQSVEERYSVGQTVEGVVTHVVNFGAFARIEEGLEGLIHVSELAEGDFLHPRNVVQEGDTVTARILNIDSARRRMGLSLRRLD
jgi:small subunit ribosomal protein S1